MTSNIVKNKLVINFYSDIIIKLYTVKLGNKELFSHPKIVP